MKVTVSYLHAGDPILADWLGHRDGLVGGPVYFRLGAHTETKGRHYSHQTNYPMLERAHVEE